MASMKKTGPKAWTVKWREGGRGRNGTQRQQTLNRYDDAVKLRDEKARLEQRRSAGLPAGNGSWLLERFYEEKFLPLRSVGVQPGTAGSWRRRWAPAEHKPSLWHVQRAWGGWALEEINAEAIMHWHADMRKAGASDAQMYRAHDLLNNILNFARKLRYIPVNEAAELRPKYAPKRMVGVWQPDTIELLRERLARKAQAAQRPSWRWARDRETVLIAVLAYAGLRPGEALALTWRNLLDEHLWVTHTIPGLDDDADSSTIETGRTKTNNDRRIPFEIAPFLRLILLEWKARVGPHHEDSPIFPISYGGGACWSYNKWVNWRRTQWAPLLEAAGVEYRKPYHLRHSWVTMMIYSGMPLPTVAKLAGHRQATCMGTYSHAWDTIPSRPFVIAEAFALARQQTSAQRPTGGFSIVRGGRGGA